MKALLLIALIVPLILFSGASGCQTQTHTEQPLSSPEQEQTAQLQQQITDLQEENKQLSSQVENLQSQLEKYQPKELESYPDLKTWTEDEIVEAMGKVDKKFFNLTAFTFEYDLSGTYYYDLEGPIYQTPFYRLAYDKIYTHREWPASHLQIYDLAYTKERQFDLEIADSAFEEYKAKVLVETTIDKEMNCLEQTDCRNIKLISCKKGANDFYIWYADRFMITARDDAGAAYTAFKKLYCTKETSTSMITGSVIYKEDNKKFSVWDFLNSII